MENLKENEAFTKKIGGLDSNDLWSSFKVKYDVQFSELVLLNMASWVMWLMAVAIKLIQ